MKVDNEEPKRLCAFCRKPLLESALKRRKFCDPDCRSMSYQARPDQTEFVARYRREKAKRRAK